MSHHKNIRYFIPVLIFLAALVGACDNSSPAPQVYNPGCSVQNLIGHINQANNTSGLAIINLDYNCVYTLTEVDNTVSMAGINIHNGLPVISSEITIQGNYAEIDIQKDPDEPFFGHFFVNSLGDLELYDLTISNGNRYVGGAVINNGGDFFASSVHFNDNLAYPADGSMVAKGGAIYSDSGRVRVIDGCLFRSNMAGQTMATGANLGGAIYSKDSTLLVSNSFFLQNYAAGDGGAIYAEKSPTNDGGGLVTINDSEFNENSALQNGGALALINEVEGVLIATTWFRGSTAANYGGAIYVEGSDFIGNHLEFRLNTVDYGGAVYTKRPGEDILSIFADEYSLYIDNSAGEIGGAIFSENSDLEIEDSDFENNTANSCGAIRTGGSPELDVIAGDLAIATRIPSTARIIGTDFNYNEATLTSGGALCHVMGDLTVQDSSFYRNSAPDAGGGMIIHDKTDLLRVGFNLNLARVGGGLVIGYPLNHQPGFDWIHPAYMTFQTMITESYFDANGADYAGGALYAHHLGSVVITKSHFALNHAEVQGGGMRLEEGDMYISNSTFTGNVAAKGGGIYARGSIISNPVLDITHTTFAYNVANEEDNGGNIYNRRWGGGAINVGGSASVENTLFATNLHINCQLENGMNFSSSENYSTDNTCASLVESNPMIGPSMNNGGGTKTHALLPGSPLIDILSGCAGMTDDQRGVLRPQGSNCDPGSYEFDPNDPPAPPPPPLPDTPPDDSSGTCDPFAGMDISLMLLNVPADTLVLPLYLKIPGGVPGLEGPEHWEYRALLGEIESYQCGLQGFEDRLYCMFNLPSDAPGLALDLKLYVGDCEDPAYSQPKVTIPKPQCKAELDEKACKVAGGEMSSGDTPNPECICP